MSNVSVKDILSTSINDLHDEIWEDIPGYNGKYYISQYSRVKSLIKRKPIILKRSLSSGKHKVVLVGKCGRLISEDVGRLCAKVHIRPPEENEVIEYRDGNRFNNMANNLSWISRQDSRNKTLLRCRQSNIKLNAGESNGRAKINKIQAIEIRTLKSAGATYSQIAKKYNISIPIAQRVVEKRTWKNV
ncbi:NUMOD4 domain-containing protein [Chryseobacterium bernardetii]|uniref:NUMOD4 domain-containing protein n=1 Tax=Chryseobacterium bernardetii TaxID=1241978 RepID=UPI001626B05E|nr:NUMOD4 domain-containing protein [Chryseobacterium bernardetii]